MQLWDIEPHPQLSIKGRFQRNEHGEEVWVVVGKQTWQFNDGQWQSLAESEIFDDPQYLGEEGFSALKVDHEFAFFKAFFLNPILQELNNLFPLKLNPHLLGGEW